MAPPAFWLVGRAMLSCFQAKWQPVRVRQTRCNKSVFKPTGRANARPMTGSVGTGSREENASKLKTWRRKKGGPDDFLKFP
jgi:hypothetical protein